MFFSTRYLITPLVFATVFFSMAIYQLVNFLTDYAYLVAFFSIFLFLSITVYAISGHLKKVDSFNFAYMIGLSPALGLVLTLLLFMESTKYYDLENIHYIMNEGILNLIVIIIFVTITIIDQRKMKREGKERLENLRRFIYEEDHQ